MRFRALLEQIIASLSSGLALVWPSPSSGAGKENIRRLLRWLPIIGFLALSSSVLGLFYEKLQVHGADADNESIVSLGQFKQMDDRWSLDALMSKIDLNASYVPISDLGIILNKLREAQQYRQFLVILSAMLAALVVYVGVRLFHSYAMVNKINKALTETNDNLQAKTKELSKALSELKESEVQLVQNEKMRLLGEMVAGVAHEINTPLTYVRENLEIVSRHLHALVELEQSCKNELIGLVRDGVEGAKQISEIAIGLKNFSRFDRGRSVWFDLHDGIDSTLMIAQHMVKPHAEVTKVFGDIPKIYGSPSSIKQVILNLVTNAAEAMTANGVIKITTTRYGTDWVRLDIEDNGQGIPQEIQARIFEPFFTTKEAGKGTGLGLSIARRIVSAHGGEIFVNSKVGEGTRFTIFLPIDRAS